MHENSPSWELDENGNRGEGSEVEGSGAKLQLHSYFVLPHVNRLQHLCAVSVSLCHHLGMMCVCLSLPLCGVNGLKRCFTKLSEKYRRLSITALFVSTGLHRTHLVGLAAAPWSLYCLPSLHLCPAHRVAYLAVFISLHTSSMATTSARVSSSNMRPIWPIRKQSV